MLLVSIIVLLAVSIVFNIVFVIRSKRFAGGDKYSNKEEIVDNKNDEKKETVNNKNKYTKRGEPDKIFTSSITKDGVLVEVISRYYPKDTLVYSYESVGYNGDTVNRHLFYTISIMIRVNGKRTNFFKQLTQAELMSDNYELFELIVSEVPFDLDKIDEYKHVSGYEEIAEEVEKHIKNQKLRDRYNRLTESL